MPEGCFAIIHFSIERVVALKANTRFFRNERLNLARLYPHILYFSSKVTVSFRYGAPTQRPHWRRSHIKEQHNSKPGFDVQGRKLNRLEVREILFHFRQATFLG